MERLRALNPHLSMHHVHDPEFARLGLRGAITIVMGRRLGSPPSEEIIALLAQVFWDAWEDRLWEYERCPPRSPR